MALCKKCKMSAWYGEPNGDWLYCMRHFRRMLVETEQSDCQLVGKLAQQERAVRETKRDT